MSPDPAALLRAGREAFRPQPSDRERVLQSLAATLGAGAVGQGPHQAELTKSVAPTASTVPSWVLGGLGGLAAIGGAIVVAAHPWTHAPSQAPVAVASSMLVASPSPSAAIPVSPNADGRSSEPPRADSPASPPRATPRSSVASLSPDSLREEVRVLSRAEQQLNSGHADEALRTLAEHERRFPDGALAEERMAARVQSLCALGRLEAARADLAKFARAYPRSPHLDRARRFCVDDAP